MTLHGRPVLAAPFDGPVGDCVSVRVEDALGRDEIVLAHLLSGGDLVPDLLRDLGAVEVAHVLSELPLFLIQQLIHEHSCVGIGAVRRMPDADRRSDSTN